MKATGIVRRLDELGRVVLPIELRRENNINHGDAVEISVNGEAVILKKYVPHCIFCKDEDRVNEIMGKYICKSCLINISLIP